jgi:hypothetical protein
MEFSEKKDIWVDRGKIYKIQTSSNSNSSHPSIYALPGFCDANVTLGVNAWGGQAGVDGLKVALQTFLVYGFSDIESVGDGAWIQKVSSFIEKRQWKGPSIHKSTAPVVTKQDWEIPSALYKTISSDKELESYLREHMGRKLHIFHRNEEGYVPDLRTLYQLRAEQSKSYDWVLHTFADPFSSEEALATEWQTIFHPIHSEASNFQLKKVRWAPQMSVYYYQTKRSEKLWMEERNRFMKRSPFFQISYEEISKSFPESFSFNEEQSTDVAKDFQEYINEFRSRPVLYDNLLFASGTGFPLVYPGMGAWREVQIWEEILNNSRADSKSPIDRSNEKESSAFAFWKSLFGKEEALEIAPIRKEIGKIPEFRKIILRALTTNSCEFLKAGHRGRIEVGLDANFNLYKKNPLAMEDRLLFPDSVYQRGNLVSGKPIK